MRITVLRTAQAVGHAVAVDVAARVRANPRLVIGLAAGRTPVVLYRELVALQRRGEVDFSEATMFMLDEFVGLAEGDRRSYGAFLDRVLISHLDVDRRRVHLLDGGAADAEGECLRYERAIARAGGLDLQILGLGTNGHVGFNEPGPLVERTHPTRLAPETRRANARQFGGRADLVPARALTMGIGTIFRARSILLLATGRAKRPVLARLVEPRIASRLPASVLRLHPDTHLFLDRAAAPAAVLTP